ncbi:MAG: amidohydrolase family protein, partial [Candidatus Brocadiaceae bacterium]
MGNHASVPTVDCHVHVRGLSSLINLRAILDSAELDAMSILCVPGRGGRNVNQNAVGLLLKLLHPEHFYTFGGLHYAEPGGRPESFAEQAERMVRAGCDGMKMLEGKPTMRKELGRRLDAADYQDYYAFLESESVPVLFHVGDPKSFWDPDQVPEGARERGWFYGDGTFPTLAELRGEVVRVLEEFPDLRVIFAHFFFMSDDIDGAAAFLDRWPYTSFDLTPVWEMYGNFFAGRDSWRSFFIDYQDRILLGTDNSAGTRAPNQEKVDAAAGKVRWLRSFLSSDEELQFGGMRGRGLDLPADAVERICAGNFRRYAGQHPQRVSRAPAVEEGERAIRHAKHQGLGKATMAELE